MRRRDKQMEGWRRGEMKRWSEGEIKRERKR
jgi:hypothetical protein